MILKHRITNHRIVVSSVLLLCVLFGGASVAEEWAVVRHVSDGDTVILKDGRRVRYAGIDAPEIDHEDKKAEPYGNDALKYNKKMVLSKKVRLEFGKQKTDPYGRQVAYVFLADGTFVNAQLLEKGLAWRMPYEGGTYDAVLLGAQQSAMSSSNGLWRLPGMKENRKYLGNSRSLRFHDVSCPYGKRTAKRNRVVFDSKWDAFYAGHAPCAKCMPRLDE